MPGALAFLWLTLVSCKPAPPNPTGSNDQETGLAARTVDERSLVRAERRAFDGAPPVIPHIKMGADCAACHTATGIQFGEMGFAPPMPHVMPLRGEGVFARCEQCHIYSTVSDVFVESGFDPLRQDLRSGRRLNPFSPPTMPHVVFMRENCNACHTGSAAREAIRCSHPLRINCRQCHVPATTLETFARRTATDS